MTTDRVLCVALVISLAALANACGDSEPPAGPSTPAVPSPPRVVSVEVTGGSVLFERGQTQRLVARALLSNGFVEDRSGSASWASSNSGVASVSSAGVVTAGDEGETTISATVEGQRGTLGLRVKYGIRTPDPPPGQRIPKPNEAGFVAEVIRSRPDLLARSCQPESGGNGTWELMDLIVDRLRAEKDLSWGYNWGPGPDEGSRDTYSWDILVGHCGSNPSPAWQDVSDLGTIWISRGRF
jgi:hypothetical protein